jgi:hypothetical protein
MNAENYKQLLTRFKNYIQSLDVRDPFVKEHFDLKVKHTYHVVSNAMIIAERSGLPLEDVLIAKVIALTHDIGRFQQFVTYHTFDDRLSVNHAGFGVKILNETNFFNGLADEKLQSLIVQSILNHNIPAIEPCFDERTMLFSKILRDADKLDIWQLLTERNVVNTILDEKEPDVYEVPVPVYECYLNQQVVPFVHATTMNDYRLLRLSWIFDMNFAATYQLITERDYAGKILAKIPDSEKKTEIAGIILQFIARRANNS